MKLDYAEFQNFKPRRTVFLPLTPALRSACGKLRSAQCKCALIYATLSTSPLRRADEQTNRLRRFGAAREQVPHSVRQPTWHLESQVPAMSTRNVQLSIECTEMLRLCHVRSANESPVCEGHETRHETRPVSWPYIIVTNSRGW
jgi:hypothetical protein